MGFSGILLALLVVSAPLPALQQSGDANRPTANPIDYVVGPQDVLTITSYDQTDLSGKFTIEADGTFTFPLIGRFTAGGSTLRQVEHGLKARLMDEGYFRNPQITVAVE